MRFRLRTQLIVFLLLGLSAPWWVPALHSFFNPPRELPEIHVHADWDKMTPEEIDQLWEDVRKSEEQLAKERDEMQKAVNEYNRSNGAR